MDEDVSNLMMGTFGGGGSDEFGRDPEDERTILTLDRTLEIARTIGSRLLELPVEILADIVELIANDASGHAENTLSSLAFVNDDCRQLARSAQFADVTFDYSPAAHALVRTLARETKQRKKGAVQPTIGACIRRVTVAASPSWVEHTHHELYDSIWDDMVSKACSGKRRDKLMQRAKEHYLQDYRDLLIYAVAEGGLPNLSAVAWHDSFVIGKDFFEAVSHAGVRHLELGRLPIGEIFALQAPLAPATWPLKSLNLNLRMTLDFERENSNLDGSDNAVEAGHDALTNRKRTQGGTATLIQSIFRLCGQTLQDLHWANMCHHSDLSFLEPVSLPRLRRLTCQYSFDLGLDTTVSLLNAPLREFGVKHISRRDWPALCQALSVAPRMSDLTSVVLPGVGDDNAKLIANFLKKHTHLIKLSIGESSPSKLDGTIIPLLASGAFTKLASLSLHWEGQSIKRGMQPHVVNISEDSLAAIGTMSQLTQLCLTGGNVIGWRVQWDIDHHALRTHLRGLERLEKLAFCRDSYDAELPEALERYYQWKLVNREQEERARGRPELDTEDYFAAAKTRAVRRRRREAGTDDDHDQEDPNSGTEDVEGAHGEPQTASTGLGTDDPYDELSDDEVWELSHRNAMLDEAEQYAAVLPKLEWLYCGQRPMSIGMPSSGTSSNAVPLTSARDSCSTFLDRTFGLGDGD